MGPERLERAQSMFSSSARTARAGGEQQRKGEPEGRGRPRRGAAATAARRRAGAGVRRASVHAPAVVTAPRVRTGSVLAAVGGARVAVVALAGGQTRDARRSRLDPVARSGAARAAGGQRVVEAFAAEASDVARALVRRAVPGPAARVAGAVHAIRPRRERAVGVDEARQAARRDRRSVARATLAGRASRGRGVHAGVLDAFVGRALAAVVAFLVARARDARRGSSGVFAGASVARGVHRAMHAGAGLARVHSAAVVIVALGVLQALDAGPEGWVAARSLAPAVPVAQALDARRRGLPVTDARTAWRSRIERPRPAFAPCVAVPRALVAVIGAMTRRVQDSRHEGVRVGAPVWIGGVIACEADEVDLDTRPDLVVAEVDLDRARVLKRPRHRGWDIRHEDIVPPMMDLKTRPVTAARPHRNFVGVGASPVKDDDIRAGTIDCWHIIEAEVKQFTTHAHRWGAPSIITSSKAHHPTLRGKPDQPPLVVRLIDRRNRKPAGERRRAQRRRIPPRAVGEGRLARESIRTVLDHLRGCATARKKGRHRAGER